MESSGTQWYSVPTALLYYCWTVWKFNKHRTEECKEKNVKWYHSQDSWLLSDTPNKTAHKAVSLQCLWVKLNNNKLSLLN